MTKIEGTPGNVPIDAKKQVQKEVKGTASSTETRAAEMQAAVAAYKSQLHDLQNYLNQQFGGKIGSDTMRLLAGKLSQGKQLNFDLVKECLLEAAKKHNETISPDKLKALDQALEKIIPSEPPAIRIDTQPRKSAEEIYADIIKTLQKKAQNEIELRALVQERAMEEALKQLIEDKSKVEQDIKDKEVAPKKFRPPSDRV